MDKEKSVILSSSSSSNMVDMVKGTLEDFNQAIKSLAETRKSLERDVTVLTDEREKLKKDRSVLEVDIIRAQEVSMSAVIAKAAEEEKQDALKRNQELRSYLDSAADTIKSLGMKLVEGDSEIKRLHKRIELLKEEKLSLVKEKENIQAEMLRMNDMLSEQDLKLKELTAKLDRSGDDRKFLESELESTKQTLDEIQKSMVSIKEKMRRSYLNPSLDSSLKGIGGSTL